MHSNVIINKPNKNNNIKINNSINSDIHNFPKKIGKKNIRKKAEIRENNDEFIGLTKKEISESEEREKKECLKLLLYDAEKI